MWQCGPPDDRFGEGRATDVVARRPEVRFPGRVVAGHNDDRSPYADALESSSSPS